MLGTRHFPNCVVNRLFLLHSPPISHPLRTPPIQWAYYCFVESVKMEMSIINGGSNFLSIFLNSRMAHTTSDNYVPGTYFAERKKYSVLHELDKSSWISSAKDAGKCWLSANGPVKAILSLGSFNICGLQLSEFHSRMWKPT